MTRIAVIAHAGKTFGGGLPELRRELARQGVVDPLWIEVPKSRYVPKQVTRALAEGAELLFAWGGDGTVQRCIDALAGSDTALAILPAGTANLLATNLDIPQDIEQAVAIGLRGERRKIDVGCFDGERFAVMAGAGFDASMIQQADGDAQGPARPRRLRLDRLAEPARQAVQGEDQGRRRPLVLGRRELHPRRQRRPALRRHRGLRGRTSRRRPLRDRRRQRRRDRRLGAHARSHGGGAGRAVAARPGDHGATKIEVKLEPQGALRARRRRPEQGQVVQGQACEPGAVTLCVPEKAAEQQWQARGTDSGVSLPSAHAAGEGFVNSPHVRDPFSRRLRRARG